MRCLAEMVGDVRYVMQNNDDSTTWKEVTDHIAKHQADRSEVMQNHLFEIVPMFFEENMNQKAFDTVP